MVVTLPESSLSHVVFGDSNWCLAHEVCPDVVPQILLLVIRVDLATVPFTNDMASSTSLNSVILHLMYSTMLFYCILYSNIFYMDNTKVRSKLWLYSKTAHIFCWCLRIAAATTFQEQLWWLRDGASIVCHTTASVCTTHWCGCLLAQNHHLRMDCHGFRCGLEEGKHQKEITKSPVADYRVMNHDEPMVSWCLRFVLHIIQEISTRSGIVLLDYMLRSIV